MLTFSFCHHLLIKSLITMDQRPTEYCKPWNMNTTIVYFGEIKRSEWLYLLPVYSSFHHFYRKQPLTLLLLLGYYIHIQPYYIELSQYKRGLFAIKATNKQVIRVDKPNGKAEYSLCFHFKRDGMEYSYQRHSICISLLFRSRLQLTCLYGDIPSREERLLSFLMQKRSTLTDC